MSDARTLVVIDVVGLTPRLLDGGAMPRLSALAKDGGRAALGTVLPAVTCSAQSTLLTGRLPREHGVVGNGWYYRDLAEVWFWRQSNRLVTAEKVWETARARDAEATTAQMFWWYNMYADVDWSVTPRPFYPADGRKLPAIYGEPPELPVELERDLGAFPFFNFWGPTADIRSSRWIAAAARRVLETRRPRLMLVYLPHLDYPLQRVGPDHPSIATECAAIDEVTGDLADAARAAGAGVLVLSEYGIVGVRAPAHPNRALREAGLIRVRETPNGEILDYGASRAFAVSDHQVAHVYVRDAADLGRARDALAGLDGVAEVLDADGKARHGLDHTRAGELVALSEPDRFFTYYYWLDDARAPDFARTVDIHRKPGYDAAELHLDPSLLAPKLRVVRKLIQKKLGFRYLMDVIPIDSSCVKGSHGLLPTDAADGPVLLASDAALLERERYEATEVRDLMLRGLGL